LRNRNLDKISLFFQMTVLSCGYACKTPLSTTATSTYQGKEMRRVLLRNKRCSLITAYQTAYTTVQLERRSLYFLLYRDDFYVSTAWFCVAFYASSQNIFPSTAPVLVENLMKMKSNTTFCYGNAFATFSIQFIVRTT